MQTLNQNQIQDVMGHPEVIIPQELLGHAFEKGSDAHELKIGENGNIHLPLTYEQALKKKNSTPFWDSMHWFAASIMYQWMKYDPDVVRAVNKK